MVRGGRVLVGIFQSPSPSLCYPSPRARGAHGALLQATGTVVAMPAKKAAAKKRAPAKQPEPVLANRRAVVATLARLEADPEVDARAQLALTLADQLDAGAGMATAAVSKELRAVLAELEEAGSGDDDFDQFIAGLSAQVVDGKD